MQAVRGRTRPRGPRRVPHRRRRPLALARLLARIYELFPLRADDFDQAPAFDPTAPEPVPELDLDQTCGA